MTGVVPHDADDSLCHFKQPQTLNPKPKQVGECAQATGGVPHDADDSDRLRHFQPAPSIPSPPPPGGSPATGLTSGRASGDPGPFPVPDGLGGLVKAGWVKSPAAAARKVLHCYGGEVCDSPLRLFDRTFLPPF